MESHKGKENSLEFSRTTGWRSRGVQQHFSSEPHKPQQTDRGPSAEYVVGDAPPHKLRIGRHCQNLDSWPDDLAATSAGEQPVQTVTWRNLRCIGVLSTEWTKSWLRRRAAITETREGAMSFYCQFWRQA